MSNIIDIRGFDFSDREHLENLNRMIEEGFKFDNMNDLTKTLANLIEEDNDMSKALQVKLLDADVYPQSFYLDKNERCPICGYPIVKSDDFESSSCVLCNYMSSNYVDWELQRELDNNVLIWSAHFNGRSVCDERLLKEILNLLYRGSVPDKIKYKQKMEYKFRESFMNETVVNSSMSEFEKFENTVLAIIFNCEDKSIRKLCEDILRELHHLEREDYMNVKEVERKELARMVLTGAI